MNTKTVATAAELRERVAQLATQLEKAHTEEQERTEAAGRENAAMLAAGKEMPEDVQEELDRLRTRIRALVAAHAETSKAVQEAEERERVGEAISKRAEHLVPKLAEANQHAAAATEALDALAKHVCARRAALVDASRAMPRRLPDGQIHVDGSWRQRVGNMHAKHVLSCSLMNRLGVYFEYDGMPPMGWRSDVDLESRELAASMLTFFDAVHGLTQYGLAGVPMADGAADPGVERGPASQRVHGLYAGAQQVTG